MQRLLFLLALSLALTGVPLLAQETMPPPHSDGGTVSGQPPPGTNFQGGESFRPPMMQPPPGNYEGGTPPNGRMPSDNYGNYGESQPGPNMHEPRSERGMERGGFFGFFGREPRGDMGEQRGMEERGEMMGGDEENDERMNKQRLQQAKQMIRGMESGLRQTKKKIDNLTAKKVNIPAEYTATVTELTTAVSTIKAATEWSDEVEAAQEVLGEKGEELREIGPALGMLEQWPKIVKRAGDEVKRIKSQLAKIKAKKLAGTESAIISIEAKISEVGTALSEAQSTVAAGNFEEAMDSLEENVFSKIQDIRDDFMILENISNASKMTKEVEREISRIEKEAKRLAAKKKDVTELNRLTGEMRAKFSELKALLASGTADRDDLFQIFSDAEALHNDALEEMAHLNGQKSDVEKEINISGASTPLGAFLLSAYYAIF